MPKLGNAMTHDGGESQPIATACDLLSDPVRRHVLYYLHERGPATREELADVVSTWLAARSADGAVTTTERNSVAVELSHVHLPKLETADVLKSNGDEWTMASVPIVFEELLETTAAHEQPATEPIEATTDSTRFRAEE